MKTLVVIFVLTTCQGGHCWNAHRLWSATDIPELPSIIGGDKADHGEFPYQVSIQHKGIFGQYHVCGGSIVNEKYILTAAHCVDSINVQNLRVIAGMTSLVDDVDTKQEVHINSAVVHEFYSSATNDNDISIIKLETDLEFNDVVSAIGLPNQDVTLGSTCIMTGWGAITETGDVVDDLYKVTLPVVERLICRTFYGQAAITDGMMCAGKITGGVGSCDGDKGGPLQCDGFLHGISSWGTGCAEPSYPGVYTMVAFYKDWIEQYIYGFH